MLDIANKMAAEIKVKRCKVRHGSGHSTNLMLRELFMHCLKAQLWHAIVPSWIFILDIKNYWKGFLHQHIKIIDAFHSFMEEETH
jgi:hypothetical protein